MVKIHTAPYFINDCAVRPTLADTLAEHCRHSQTGVLINGSLCVFKGFYCVGVSDNPCNVFRRLNIVNLYDLDNLFLIGFITNLFAPFGWGLLVIAQLFENVIIGGAPSTRSTGVRS